MGWSDDYLEHHGILGQKWGVRRFESANGHLTSAGKNRYNTDSNGDYQKLKKKPSGSNVESAGKKKTSEEENTEEKKKGLSDKQKKALVIGAAAVGTAVAAYGGYKIYKHVQNTKQEAYNHIMQKGETFTKSALKTEHSNEMQSVNKYLEALSSKDGHHTSSGSILVDPKAYRDHWTNVSQSHKAEINQTYKDVKANAKQISGSYRSSKAYLNYEKQAAKSGTLRDLTDLSNGTKNFASLSGKKAGNTKVQKPEINKLASEASSLARSVKAEGPKSFPKSTTTTNKVISIHGQQKFNQASKANDDLVQSLLKKNAASLAGYSMDDLKKLDLY